MQISTPDAARPALSPAPVGRRLLLVEDGALNRQLARTLLERGTDFVVEVAENGAEALDRVERGEPFAVILMDLDMPVMDGFEAVAAIRARLDGRGAVPIIAMSAMTRPADLRRARGLGVDGHIAKPFLPGRLAEEVERCLRAATAAVAARLAGRGPAAQAAPAAPAASLAAAPAWNSDACRELALETDGERVARTLAMFRARMVQARAALARDGGATRRAAEARALASGAAVLGFEALAATCRAASQDGAVPLDAAVEAALAALDRQAGAGAAMSACGP